MDFTLFTLCLLINNAMKNLISVMKPTRTLTPYAHTNRAQSLLCRITCEEYQIFPFVYSEEPIIPWVMTLAELSIPDRRFKLVLGAKSSKIPKKLMKYGKRGNSHDTIMYEING